MKQFLDNIKSLSIIIGVLVVFPLGVGGIIALILKMYEVN